MYTLAVRRNFIARHYLIGGDWGPEKYPTSHHSLLELQLSGRDLDRHGYLVDITEVEKNLDQIIDHYKEQMLNELPEFAGLNPSIEHFARILATSLNERLQAPGLAGLKVVLWENDSAWTSYEIQR
jgi:6-pyruvoyltetrahydropterin/6-carboxytetrahydropterin synthase